MQHFPEDRTPTADEFLTELGLPLSDDEGTEEGLPKHNETVSIKNIDTPGVASKSLAAVSSISRSAFSHIKKALAFSPQTSPVSRIKQWRRKWKRALPHIQLPWQRIGILIISAAITAYLAWSMVDACTNKPDHEDLEHVVILSSDSDTLLAPTHAITDIEPLPADTSKGDEGDSLREKESLPDLSNENKRPLRLEERSVTVGIRVPDNQGGKKTNNNPSKPQSSTQPQKNHSQEPVSDREAYEKALKASNISALQRLAEKGYTPAYGALAQCYISNKKFSTAVYWAKKASGAGDERGKRILEYLKELDYPL